MPLKEIENILNDILSRPEFADIRESLTPKRLRFPNGFRWRYYGKLKLKRGLNAYCYSTTKNANGKYLSWVYQPKIKEQMWDFTHVVEHSKRKDAKARALKLYTT